MYGTLQSIMQLMQPLLFIVVFKLKLKKTFEKKYTYTDFSTKIDLTESQCANNLSRKIHQVVLTNRHI